MTSATSYSDLNRAHADRSQSSIAGSSDPLPPSKSTPLNTGSSSHTTSGDDARILVVSSTSSASNQYVGLMNCIFAAQKRRIPIDVLKIAGEDTVFLQQAASLTKGLYLRAGDLKQGRLLQTLLTTFLPPPSWRTRLLNLPTLDEVDFRASCFCHGAIVDVGYVCGVCLSSECASQCTKPAILALTASLPPRQSSVIRPHAVSFATQLSLARRSRSSGTTSQRLVHL